jgi:hypothetical protein
LTKSIKIIIGVFLLAGSIGFISLMWLITWSGESEIPETVNDYVVDFEKADQKIYIRAKAWGGMISHEEITVCLSPDMERPTPSTEGCTVFYATELYYKKDGPDSLRIYVNADAEPREKKSTLGPIKLVITELKTIYEIRDVDKRGLSKATVFEENK